MTDVDVCEGFNRDVLDTLYGVPEGLNDPAKSRADGDGPAGPEPVVVPPGERLSDRIPRLDWEAAFAQDYSNIDWLPGKIMERGQQMSLVGAGKTGKSLLTQDWMRGCVMGERFLGDVRHEPLTVLYFDKENSQRDVITRMIAFGAKPEDLKRFDYRLFPRFSGALNSSWRAAAELLEIVDEVQPDIVVLDTASRFIDGPENDSNTWLDLYQKVHERLKARGVACIRIDHFGKDTERGARGSSAKGQDVDHVWELTVAGDERRTHDKVQGIETVHMQLKLHRKDTRSGLGRSLFWITRVAQQEKDESGEYGQWLPGRSRHSLAEDSGENARNTRVESCVDALVNAGLTEPLSREKLLAWADEHRVKVPRKNTEIAPVVAAVRARLAR